MPLEKKKRRSFGRSRPSWDPRTKSIVRRVPDDIRVVLPPPPEEEEVGRRSDDIALAAEDGGGDGDRRERRRRVESRHVDGGMASMVVAMREGGSASCQGTDVDGTGEGPSGGARARDGRSSSTGGTKDGENVEGNDDDGGRGRVEVVDIGGGVGGNRGPASSTGRRPTDGVVRRGAASSSDDATPLIPPSPERTKMDLELRSSRGGGVCQSRKRASAYGDKRRSTSSFVILPKESVVVRANSSEGRGSKAGLGFEEDGLTTSFERKGGEEGRHRPKEGRVVLGDRSNTANDTQTGDLKQSILDNRSSGMPTTSDANVDRPRTKSARRKKKRALPLDQTGGTSDKRPRTTVQFFVPAFDLDENGSYQEQKHFGLIEGMGGGEEESEKGRHLPHRGRVLEIPGSVMPGKWEALILNDASGEDSRKDYGLRFLRISLRHNSALSTPLEKYYCGEMTTPNRTIVSLFKPSVNRVSSFIKQGIFTDDEIDFCVEGGETMSKDSGLFLGCLSLVTFGGFASSSESMNDADDCSKAMLSCCAWPSDRQADRNALYKIVSREKDADVTGILFPCKINFDYEYSILISHDDKFRVAAIDVIFRKPKASRRYSSVSFGLTESMLSEHQNDSGLDDREIMTRFVDQRLDVIVKQLWRNGGNKQEGISNAKEYDRLNKNKYQQMDRKKSSIPANLSAFSINGMEIYKEQLAVYKTREGDLETTNVGKSKANLDVAKLGEVIEESEAGKEEANKAASIESDPVKKNGNTRITTGQSEKDSNTDDGMKQVIDAPEEEAFSTGETLFDGSYASNGISTSSDCELLRDGTSSRSFFPHTRPSKQDGEGVVLKDDLIDEHQVVEACSGGENELTLTASYADFEKRRQTSKCVLLSTIDDNILTKDAGSKLSDEQRSISRNRDGPVVRREDGGRTITSKEGGVNPSNLRRPLNSMKMIIREVDVIGDSLVASRRGEDTTQRWSSDGGSTRFRAVQTTAKLQKAMRRQSLLSTTDTRVKQMTNTTQKQQHRAVDINMIEAMGDKVTATSLLERRKISQLKMDASSDNSNLTTAKKRKVACINSISSMKKEKVASVVDLFGEMDSLFGCEIVSTRKEKHSGKKSNRKVVCESKTTIIDSYCVKPQRFGKHEIDQRSNAKEECGRRNGANPTSIERVHFFPRVLFKEGNNDEGENATGSGGQIRRSNRARQQTKFFMGWSHRDSFQGGIHDDNDNDDASPDESSNGDAPAAVRRKSSRSTAYQGKMKDPSNSIADLLKSVGPATSNISDRTCLEARQRSPRRSYLKTRSSAVAEEEAEAEREEEGDDNEDVFAAVDGPPNNRNYTFVDFDENHLAKSTLDDQSINTADGASCSFGSYNDDRNDAVTQPIYDVYFGLEDEQSAVQLTPPILQNFSNEFQHLHDVYFGQESDIDTDEEEDYVRLPTHGVYFGLDDSNSLAESQLGTISMTDPTSEVPYHDSYFGQEAYRKEDSVIHLNDTEQMTTRIPRCNIRSKPLLVMALLAGMLSRAL